MQRYKEAAMAVYRHERPEMVVSGNMVYRSIPLPGDRFFGGQEGEDMFGVRWTNLGPDPGLDGSTPTPGYKRLSDITRWREEVRFPDLESLPLKKMFESFLQNYDRDQHVIHGLIMSGLFERMHHLIGMEDALCAFYEEPEAVHAFFHALADYKIKCISLLIDYADPDVILMHDDWGMHTNMFFSPDIWREFIKPHEKRFAEYIHERGKIYEHHSCGYVTPIVGDLVEIGVDALNPLNVCNDIEGVMKKYGGEIAVLGGLNSQLIDHPNTTEEEVRREVRRAIDAYAPLGCYMPYYIATNAERQNIVIDEVKNYGTNFYRNS